MAGPALFARFSVFRTILPLSLASAVVFLAGCNGTTCFVGIINGGNTGVIVNSGNVPAACTSPQIPPVVAMNVHLTPACFGCSSSRQVSNAHLIVTGIALHPSAIADETSPDWQELSPSLKQHPQQLELTQDPSTDKQGLPGVISGQIPAGSYYRLRLYLAEASSLDSADGRTYPLLTQDGRYQLEVQLNSPIVVSNGRVNEIRVELQPEWALVKTAAGTVEVAPQLLGHVEALTPEPLSN